MASIERAEHAARSCGAFVRLLAVLLALFAATAQAQTSPSLRIGIYQTAANALPQDVEQLPASAFRTPPPGPIVLRGEPGKAFWLRIDVNLPPVSDDDARWLLWLDHAPIDRLSMHWSGEQSRHPASPLHFFAPSMNPAARAGGYGFALPRGLSGPTTLYLNMVVEGTASVAPRIGSDSEAVSIDRTAVMLFTAVYTGLLLLIVMALGMYAALRDRMYLYYLGYLAALLVFLLAHNGHLYELPGIGKFGHWRSLGLYALSNLLAAATIALARQFAGLKQARPRTDRLLALAPLLPMTFAFACLLAPVDLVQPIQDATIVVSLGALLLAVFATLFAWLQKRHLALPVLFMWLLLFGVACMRGAIPFGMAPINIWTQYGYQVVAGLTALMLGFALSDRILEFRVQRDRARLAKDQVDASLRLELERRKFIESLADLRDASGGDQDWLAFRRLLEALRQLVPQQSSAVTLNGFHGTDLLLCEPNAAREQYQALLATRGGAFKGISRSQFPMQLRMDMPTVEGDESQDLVQFAVMPLNLTLPAWGVLLIERRGWQNFERDELTLANEFVVKATQAVEAAANDRAVRQSAEFDALTGALNRRSLTARLDVAFRHSVARLLPLAVLFVDLDHVKELNDKHGHAAGDQCLRFLSDTIARHCEKAGEFGRFGGGEFVVILPERDPDQAKRWAEAMRADAIGQDMTFPSGSFRLRVSVGIGSRRPEDTTAQHLLERADKALQEARRMGSNQVQSAPSHSAVRGVR